MSVGFLTVGGLGSASNANPIYTPTGTISSGESFSGASTNTSSVVRGAQRESGVGTGFRGANFVQTATRFSADAPAVYLRGPNATDATYAFNQNAAGTSAGFVRASGAGDVPTIWTASGVRMSLSLLPQSTTPQTGQAIEINDSGTVAGISTYTGSNRRYKAVRWDAGSTTPVELTTPNGQAAEVAAINAAGTIVGRDILEGGQAIRVVPTRWATGSITGTYLDLPGPAESGNVRAINASGVTVGQVTAPAGTPGGSSLRPARWAGDSSTLTLLGGLGGDASVAGDVVAVNSTGTSVGYSAKSDGGVFIGRRATRWAAGSDVAVELVLPAATPYPPSLSAATAINDEGVAVGYYSDSAFSNDKAHAMAWLPDGTAIDLNRLVDPGVGWTLNVATSVGAENWITGFGLYDADGAGPMAATSSQFLIQLPEPTSVAALFFIGIALPATRRRSS